MDLFLNAFTHGIALLFDPALLGILLFGTLWGVVGGGHPGGSATLTLSVMIPLTFLMTPVQAVAFLLSMMVGVNYGNGIPAILLGLPGTPSAFLTAIDGYELHRRGKTGLAMGAMFISARIGELLGILGFIALVIPLAMATYSFLAPEYFALYLLGMAAVANLLGKSLLKGYISVAIGLAFTVIGADPLSSVSRFAGTVPDLRAGLEPIPVLIGFLALSEVMRHTRQVYDYQKVEGRFAMQFPWSQLRRLALPIGIGSIVGTLTGAVPGAEATAGAVISYNQARVFSKHKEEFGHGSVEGIAATVAAENAAQAGDMIPTLGLGIPAGGTSALVLAAIMIHGVVPGPMMLRDQPELLYAAVAGLLAASAYLWILGWPIARLMAKLVSLNRSAVTSFVVVLMLVGVFALDQSTFDVIVLVVAGVVGYYMRRYGYSVGAAALGAILGRGLERNLREGLALTENNPIEFVTRPLTGFLLIVVIGLFVIGFIQSYRLQKAGHEKLAVTG